MNRMSATVRASYITNGDAHRISGVLQQVVNKVSVHATSRAQCTWLMLCRVELRLGLGLGTITSCAHG